MNDLDGVIWHPSEIVYDLLQKYKDQGRKKRIIQAQGWFGQIWPTGNHTPTETAALREKYEVAEDETLLLSLS